MTEWFNIWGPPILQVFVILLVFAWGLPGILLQSIQPPALQKLVRNTFYFSWPAIVIIVLLVSGAVFVLAVSLGWTPVVIGSEKAPHSAVIWILGASSLLGIASVFYFRALRLDEITARVGARALSCCRRMTNSCAKQGDHIKLSRALESLAALGEMAQGRGAKAEILKILDELEACVVKLAQDGDSSAVGLIEKHTRAVRKTVTAVGASAHAANFSSALKILRKMYDSLTGSSPEYSERVGRVIVRVSRHLVTRALAEPSSGLEAALGYSTEVTRDQPAELFWIGAKCAGTYSIEGSMPAFRRLVARNLEHTLGSNEGELGLLQKEAEAKLVGLGAILRNLGPNMAHWVDQGLRAALGQWVTAEILGRTSQYLVRVSEFAVADLLVAWRQELAGADETRSLSS